MAHGANELVIKSKNYRREFLWLAIFFLIVGVLLVWNQWPWFYTTPEIGLCVLSLGLFWGSKIALQAALLFCRVYLLLWLPIQFWPFIQVHIWEYHLQSLDAFFRYDLMPAVAMLVAYIFSEIIRKRLHLPLCIRWNVSIIMLACAVALGRQAPALWAQWHVDPAAQAAAIRFENSIADDIMQFTRDDWWENQPWNEFEDTAPWQRPVMMCHGVGYSDLDWFSIGPKGIGPWIRHPRAGQPPRILDYQFRDGSRWRGVEVTHYFTTKSGERVGLTYEFRISSSPPTHEANTKGESYPQRYPEY